MTNQPTETDNGNASKKTTITPKPAMPVKETVDSLKESWKKGSKEYKETLQVLKTDPIAQAF